MKIINLQQGSESWLAHRRTVRNASDAPAMMGASPYVTRSALVKRYATGIEPEIDAATQARFDRGHEVEPALRAYAEGFIGEDLYPVTATSDDGYLGASFDGVTLSEDVILEAKQSNQQKRIDVECGDIPAADYWQIVQQFAVNENASSCIYLVGDGTEDGTARPLVILRGRIEDDIPKLMAGWAQFDADVAAYQPEPAVSPEAVGRAPDQLPALHIEVTGLVTSSNLREWKDAAIAVFQGISSDLQTDQDFADAEKAVKWCGEIEDQLKAAKQHALGQTASIDELFRTIDAISAEARSKRLELDKLVKSRKESLRTEILTAGRDAVRAHVDQVNVSLGQYAIPLPATLTADLAAAIKGKKSFASMRDAVDATVANAKIAASQTADRVRANVAILAEHEAHASLFADRVMLCASKSPEDLRNLVAARVADHQQREAEKLEAERERIRQEEAEKAAAAQRAKEQAAVDSSHGIATSGGGFDSGEVPDRARQLTDSASHVQGDGTLGADGPTTATAAFPPSNGKSKRARPTDRQIIDVLALHYRVHDSKIIEWLFEMDLDSASAQLSEAM